jgi:hypothetical protein
MSSFSLIATSSAFSNSGLKAYGGLSNAFAIPTDFSCNVSVGSNLTVAGAAMLSNGLVVFGGTTSLRNSLSVSGAAALSNGLSVSGNAVVSGTSYVAGDATFSNAVMSTGALTTYGINRFSNAVYVSSNLTATGVLALGGGMTNNKIVALNDTGPTDAPSTATNFYGLGVNVNALRMQTPSASQSYKWYAGVSNTMTLDGAGSLGVGSNLDVAAEITATGGATMDRIWDYSGTMTVEGKPGPISAALVNGAGVVASSLSPFASSINNTEGSVYLPGAVGNYLTVAPAGVYPAAATVTLPSFTFECWIYLPVLQSISAPHLIGQMSPTTNSTINYWSFGVGGNTFNQVAFSMFTGSVGCLVTGSTAISVNTWTHIACSYTASTKTLFLFVNGAAQTHTVSEAGTGGASAVLTNAVYSGGATSLTVGQYYNHAMNCYVSNLRYTHEALYSAAFTPSSAPLHVFGTKTVLLLRAQAQVALSIVNPVRCVAGVRGHSLPSDALIYVDCYGANLPNLSGANAPTFDTTKAMCVRFDRTQSQFLSFATQTFNVGSRGFTAICKFAFTGALQPYEQVFLCGQYYAAYNLSLHRLQGFSSLKMDINGVANNASTYVVLQNVINTVAIRYDPFTNNDGITSFGTLTQWINGVINVSSVSGAVAVDQTLAVVVGGGTADYLSGDIYAFAAYNRALTDREIKDASRTLMAATTGLPREAAFEAGTENAKPALTVKRDGTLALAGPIACTNDTSFYTVDHGVCNLPISGSMANLYPTSNSACPAVAMSPFSGASEGSLLVSSSNYMMLSNAVFTTPTTSGYTVEAWINPTGFRATDTGNYLLSDEGISVGMGFSNNCLQLYNYASGTGTFLNGTTPIQSNAWTHVAWAYSNLTLYAFVNGLSQGTAAVTGLGASVASTGRLAIGGSPTNSVYTPFPTYLTNVRVTCGAALYTSTFVPPTAPLGPSPSGTTALLLRVPQKQGRMLVNKIGGTADARAYPPAAMTSHTTNVQNASYATGTYIASSSGSGNEQDRPAWKPFTRSSANDGWWSSMPTYNTTDGSYSGTTLTYDNTYRTGYSGEWLQLQTPGSITLSSYCITTTSSTARSPGIFFVLGSQDGVNWTSVSRQTASILSWPAGWTTNTYTVATCKAFRFFRMVVNSTCALTDGYCSIAAWTLYGTQEAVTISPDGCVGLGVGDPKSVLEVAGTSIFNGNVGIGTTSPAYKLDVAGDVNVAGVIRTTNTFGNKKLVLWDDIPAETVASGTSYYGLGINPNAMRYQAQNHKWYSAATNIMTLDSSGNLTCTANITAYSDARLKDDIRPIADSLSKIDRIGGYTYTRKDIQSSVRYAGVLAHEVREVLPEVVHENADGYLSVSYGNMVALLVEGIKELNGKLAELQTTVADQGGIIVEQREAIRLLSIALYT